MEKAKISIRTVQHDKKVFGVEVFITGLESKEQAEAARMVIETLLCGDPVQLSS